MVSGRYGRYLPLWCIVNGCAERHAFFSVNSAEAYIKSAL